MFFGRGLVADACRFRQSGPAARLIRSCSTGWRPRFVESGWNLKALQKQHRALGDVPAGSTLDAKRLEQDPANEWLARGPSYRLAAEQIRDSALAASGLLVRTVGGPSVYPYQPAGTMGSARHAERDQVRAGARRRLSIAAASTPSGSGRRRRRRRSASTRRSGCSAPSTGSARIRRCRRWCC